MWVPLMVVAVAVAAMAVQAARLELSMRKVVAVGDCSRTQARCDKTAVLADPHPSAAPGRAPADCTPDRTCATDNAWPITPMPIISRDIAT
jgi:hypothetical protein